MIPFSTLGERVDFLARVGVTYSVMLLLFVLNVVVLPYPLSGVVEIPFILCAIYYWSIYRPTLIPVLVVFIAGLLVDILNGMPIGLNALSFVLAHWVISDQRNFLTAQSFWMIWLGFIMLFAIIMMVEWLGIGIVRGYWKSPEALLPNLMTGFATFPVIASVLHLSHKILPDPDMPLTRQSKV